MGFIAYCVDMNKIIKADIKSKIAEMLIQGENPENVREKLSCDISEVMGVLSDERFSLKAAEILRSQAQGFALIGLHNIARIANDKEASHATQLKASIALNQIAREYGETLADDLEPSTMSQSQLAARLKALQNEANVRAKPIDTGVIDQSIDDMLE